MRIPAELERLAQRQHGVFSRADLRALGVSAKQERLRVAAGLWVPVLGNSYVTASTPIGLWQRASAASLLTGGVLSHATAAEIHRLPVNASRVVHVWVSDNQHVKIDGLRSHRGPPPDDDVEVAIGLLVTTRSRTIVDCLATLPFDAAMALARDSVFRRWVTVPGLQRSLAPRRGMRGTPQLARVVARLTPGGASEAERLLHKLLRRAGIRGWLANQVVRDHLGPIGETDVLFPELRLVIEVDGFTVHGTDRQVFQRDRAKQNRLINAGYTVLRFTWSDLVDRPDDVIATILSAVARLSAQMSPKRA